MLLALGRVRRVLLQLLQAHLDRPFELGVHARARSPAGRCRPRCPGRCRSSRPASRRRRRRTRTRAGWSRVPSTRRWRGQMPITPPQVRLPTSGPSFSILKVWREDVAVRAGQLVGERDHRAARRLVGVGLGRAPAREVVAEPAPRQLLEQQPRDVAAAVEAHVDDQRRRGRTRPGSRGGTRRSPPGPCRGRGCSRPGRRSPRAPARGWPRPSRGSAPAARRRAP